MQIVPSGFDNWSAVIVAGVLVNVLFYSSLVFLCSEAIALAARQPNLPPYPKLLRLTGCVALPGTLLLVVGSVYQQTYLTWKHGPREVWFAGAQLAGHGSILLAWLFVFVLLAHLGVATALFLIVFHLVCGYALPRSGWLPVAACFVCLALLYTPYSFWRFALVKTVGPGDLGPQQLAFAAGRGELRIVKALLARSRPIDTAGYSPTLNAACSHNRMEVARYLVSSGADLTQAPACHWLRELWPGPPPLKVPGTTVTVTPDDSAPPQRR